MRIIYIKNIRRGSATNSSSTHSMIYKNKDEVLEDLNVFELDYYDRFDNTIAATREAKIKYVLANCYYDKDLVYALLPFYPEMKKYLKKINKVIEQRKETEYREPSFGMYTRGALYETQYDTNGLGPNYKFNVDFLRYIIDTEDIAIVGGSDERDFVYGFLEDHEKVAEPEDIKHASYYRSKKDSMKYGVKKNGNYYAAYSEFKWGTAARYCGNGRLRFCTENVAPVPEYPELIDLRITNKCNNGCKFCFMDSNMKEKDADLLFLQRVVTSFPNTVEFSIGGGNVLLYPHLEEFLEVLDASGHIANITINVKDVDTILNDKKIRRIIDRYVNGVGVSVFDVKDLDAIQKLTEAFTNDGKDETTRYMETGYHEVVLHLIPEYIGAEKTAEIVNTMEKRKMWNNVLFLGYKENGRGKDCQWKKFDESDLKKIFCIEDYGYSIDTTFAQRYGDYLNKNFCTKYSITMFEGEFSMYIDGVTQNAYKSSYELDKPYKIDWVNYNKLIDIFGNIRQDCGFEKFDTREEYYEPFKVD